jgi:diaminohydroxyphosphoribosylaminopyrimidine deaminase/5-amino-6-(5-phosphoribosylamino)uracil reductase
MHERFMRMALEAAAKARGRTSPNPMVGCVLVQGGEVIAVGHHRRAGAAHAEVVALRRAGEAARGATAYVNLEPCAHHGRTGPCTEALIAAGVRSVVVGVQDPCPLVNGRGLRALRAHGIEVVTGVLRGACAELNEAFLHYHRTATPFVIAKLAMTLDGRVATVAGQSKWITSAAARRRGHLLRHEVDAVVVGVGTVLADDPRLTARIRGGRHPRRIILDRHARTPPGAQALDIVIVGADAPGARVRALVRAGATVVEQGGGIREFLRWAAAQGFLSILVEGGPRVLGSFFDAGAVHRVDAFIAAKVFGGQSLAAVLGEGAPTVAGYGLVVSDVVRLGPDVHLVLRPRRRAVTR